MGGWISAETREKKKDKARKIECQGMQPQEVYKSIDLVGGWQWRWSSQQYDESVCIRKCQLITCSIAIHSRIDIHNSIWWIRGKSWSLMGWVTNSRSCLTCDV